MKKYMLLPGWVTSRHDGDIHFIGSEQLARLYGVSMDECCVYRGQHTLAEHDGLMFLPVRYDGNYETPGKNNGYHGNGNDDGDAGRVDRGGEASRHRATDAGERGAGAEPS